MNPHERGAVRPKWCDITWECGPLLRSHGLDGCQKRNFGANLLTHALPNTTACSAALIMK